MINVTKPNLPSLEEYTELLKGIWERNWLTNNGPLVNELELKLKEYLGLNHLLFLNNGTIAIQLALKALQMENGGEVITTPFSYVATTSSIVWENFIPVFADIDRDTLNISPERIEECISEKTVAILATHVFGNPCDITRIEQIAQKHNLKVIYDAAHCFGTKYHKRSVFEYGDISTTSFHATKLFHTIEGGAVFTQSVSLLKKMAHMRNFGHDGPENFASVGINGKNSEFHAAMGIINLRSINDILSDRQEIARKYDSYLLNSSKIMKQVITNNTEYNYSYYPVILESEDVLKAVVEELNRNYIFPRRYFYPSLSTLSYIPDGKKTPVSDDISSRILCLPCFYGMKEEEIFMIARLVLRVINN